MAVKSFCVPGYTLLCYCIIIELNLQTTIESTAIHHCTGHPPCVPHHRIHAASCIAYFRQCTGRYWLSTPRDCLRLDFDTALHHLSQIMSNAIELKTKGYGVPTTILWFVLWTRVSSLEESYPNPNNHHSAHLIVVYLDHCPFCLLQLWGWVCSILSPSPVIPISTPLLPDSISRWNQQCILWDNKYIYMYISLLRWFPTLDLFCAILCPRAKETRVICEWYSRVFQH